MSGGLKLINPRPGRSKNYRVRGTYIGVYVDRSTGAHRKEAARKVLRRIEREIEDEASGISLLARKTVADAVIEYLETCPDREVSRVKRVLDHFGDCLLVDIDDQVLKDAAKAIYPPGPSTHATPVNATINREIITPVSAIVHAAGLDRSFHRYKEPRGRIRVDDAEAIEAFLEALPEVVETKKGKHKGAKRFPRSYALFLFSCCTRRTETMHLEWGGVEPTPSLDLSQRHAVFWTTKNEDPRIVHLNQRLVVALANLPHREGRVFGYQRTEMINADWREARKKLVKKHPALKTLTPHCARHVFATWRRKAGDDLKKLMKVGGWKDYKSVLRYEHVPMEEVRDAFEDSPLNRGVSVESGTRTKPTD